MDGQGTQSGKLTLLLHHRHHCTGVICVNGVAVVVRSDVAQACLASFVLTRVFRFLQHSHHPVLANTLRRPTKRPAERLRTI